VRGQAACGGLSREDLPGDELYDWLARLAADVPDPEGDHGRLTFTVTVSWDHLKAKDGP
jgi:hypothetical protein